jgi:Helicase associated domain
MKQSKRKEMFIQNFERCKQHINDYGKLVLPCQNPETRGLAVWLQRQNKRDNVPEDEKAMLDLLGKHRDMWPQQEKQKASWNNFYDQLIKYKEEYHTLLISKKDKENKSLYNWSFRQRLLYNENRLLPERMEALSSIGFRFGKQGIKRFTKVQIKTWDTMYQELVAFNNEFGHCRVKINDCEHLKLAKWVHLQRVTFKHGKMDSKHEEKLKEIGFQWKIR